jgi:hypothetical protein
VKVTSGYEPGEPTARDLEVLALLQDRDGTLTDVQLSNGQLQGLEHRLGL